MKRMLLACVLLGGLIGCGKEAGEPVATLIGPVWSLQSQVVVATPKNGGPSTSSTRQIPAGSFTHTYRVDGTFLITGIGYASGTYSYVGKTLTLSSTIVNGPLPRILTVLELAPHKLVTVETGEDSDNRYTDTVTFTR